MQLPPLHNDTFLRACLRLPTPYTPVWLMRQAGRYLPQYLATRERAGSFMGLATHPDWACEVTLQPLECYDLDAAILFSDILTVPDAMGLGLSFVQGEGPKLAHPVRHEADVAKLEVPDMDRLRYVMDAVRTIRQALGQAEPQHRAGVGHAKKGRVPLIGFSGSPWTLACYMVEGGASDDFRLIKTMLYSRPDLLERILTVNADTVAAYLNAQIEAGAQAVMIFDTWGGVLSDGAFQRYSLAYTQRVLAQVKIEHEGYRIPRLVFTKGGGAWLEDISLCGCDVVGLDWSVDIAKARARIGHQVALQGNLDPMTLFGTPERIQAEVQDVLRRFGPITDAQGQVGGHVFNLGHGINQYTPPEHVKVLVDSVHQASQTWHGFSGPSSITQ